MRLYASVLASFCSPPLTAGKFGGSTYCSGAGSLMGTGTLRGAGAPGGADALRGAGAPGRADVPGDAGGEDVEPAGAELPPDETLFLDVMQAASISKGMTLSKIRICQYLAAIANFLFTVSWDIKLDLTDLSFTVQLKIISLVTKFVRIHANPLILCNLG
jgi:hypothetical protein